MTFIDLYIGKLSDREDPLDYGGMPPPPLSENFPPDPTRSRFSSADNYMIGQKQIDWGSWAGITTKAKIMAFTKEVYEADSSYSDPTLMPHHYERLLELRAFIDTLSEDERYALVLIES